MPWHSSDDGISGVAIPGTEATIAITWCLLSHSLLAVNDGHCRPCRGTSAPLTLSLDTSDWTQKRYEHAIPELESVAA